MNEGSFHDQAAELMEFALTNRERQLINLIVESYDALNDDYASALNEWQNCIEKKEKL